MKDLICQMKSLVCAISNVILLFLFLSCESKTIEEFTQVNKYPPIYPDYKNITLPPNIAPLNFRIEDVEEMQVEFYFKNSLICRIKGDDKIDIPLKKWESMLQGFKGKCLNVIVFTKKADVWSKYLPFDILIAKDEIDPYIAYRLIEPGYELGLRLGLFQRELSSFKESSFVDPKLSENGCVNCHAFCNYSPSTFMFHGRWINDGTFIINNDSIQRVDTRVDGMLSGGAYCMWHPSGRYIAFSTNKTYQAFHALTSKRIEVYDGESDLIIYDVKKNEVLIDSSFTSPYDLMTFPAWSPNGKSLYFCKANPVQLPYDYKNLKYQLYRKSFDADNGKFIGNIEKINLLQDSTKSVSFPVVSPDGKYLLYTLANSGTFPIWHKEADLGMIDLARGKLIDLETINSNSSDSYHAWSSNGRWIMFSTRRANDLYTQLFFAYFDKNGKVHKPFILPQKDPDFYKYFLKSYNVPEFINGKINITPYEIDNARKSLKIQATRKIIR